MEHVKDRKTIMTYLKSYVMNKAQSWMAVNQRQYWKYLSVENKWELLHNETEVLQQVNRYDTDTLWHEGQMRIII